MRFLSGSHVLSLTRKEIVETLARKVMGTHTALLALKLAPDWTGALLKFNDIAMTFGLTV